jgi:hypothetical protein
MGRVINPESAGKERTRLTKAILVTMRELAKQAAPSANAHDMAAFIALALQEIAAGIDLSVLAWEKRGYWVKADRFRMEWLWAGQYGEKMRVALLAEDWTTIASLLAQISQRLAKVQVADHHRLGTPWTGAYEALKKTG